MVSKDCPTLGYNSTEAAWLKQAEIIKRQIESCPGDWLGVAHVNSYKQAFNLKQRLVKLGMKADKFFCPVSGMGTNQQMQAWTEYKRRHKGAIIITPSMSEGVDLLEERICIIAKIPFPAIAPGSFEAERKAYSEETFKLRTAYRVEQMAGRTRRGRPEDYDSTFEKRGLVSIVDGAFVKMGIRKLCDKDFTDALVYD